MQDVYSLRHYVKIYGEGEWKVRQYGASLYSWFKNWHLRMDPDSKEIIIAELTSNKIQENLVDLNNWLL